MEMQEFTEIQVYKDTQRYRSTRINGFKDTEIHAKIHKDRGIQG